MSAQIAGRYDLIREIGSGAMGRVFEAIDTETGRHVAVKILIAGNEIDVQALLRFQQEGIALATLKHPNIVQVHATYLEEGTSSIVMELLEGRSLGQILRAETLPLARTKRMMRQVASALAYAHSRGIIHRDVKPDNIMVVGEDAIKVTDFGIARVLRDSAPFGTLTATGATLGTPWYMSPEQIEGAKVDGRSDIYSFGAVLYQMVTGKPPFEGNDPVTVAFQHVHKAAEPPGNVNPEVPRDWEDLILTCLAKSPNDRYQTAGALGEALAALDLEGRQSPRQRNEAEAAAHDQEARSLIERARRKELSEDFAGAWRDYRAALTIASPGPVRDELNASIGRVEARIGQPAAATEAQALPGASGDATQPTRALDGKPTGSEEHPTRSRRTAMLAGTGLLLAAGIVAFVIIHLSSSTAAPAIKLTVSGRHHGNAYVSGQTVRLHWTPVSHAGVYRLEIAARNTDPADAVVFRHPLLTTLDTADSYALHVVGRQYYYWRVQAEVGSAWGQYSHSIHFLVNRPSIAVPFPLSPPDNAGLTTHRVRLCWSRVRGAAGYDLSVVGTAVSNPQTSTCAWLVVHPGNYSWRVAARVRGAHLYTGAYSQPVSFTVNVRPTPTPQPLPTATTPPASQPTAAPRPTARPKHHRNTGKPRPTRPAPARPTAAPRPTATAHPTVTARPSATPRPVHKKISFTINAFVPTRAGQRINTVALNQPFTVVLTFTVHHLAPSATVLVRIASYRYHFNPTVGYRLFLHNSTTTTGLSGRNVHSVTTSVSNTGTFLFRWEVTIKGHTKTRSFTLTVHR